MSSRKNRELFVLYLLNQGVKSMTVELRLDAVDFVGEDYHKLKSEDVIYQLIEGDIAYRALADLLSDLGMASNFKITAVGEPTFAGEEACDLLKAALWEACSLEAQVKYLATTRGLSKKQLLARLRREVCWVYGSADILFLLNTAGKSSTEIISAVPPSAPSLFREVIQVIPTSFGVVVRSRSHMVRVQRLYPVVWQTIRSMVQASTAP